ncbi:Acetylornithine deacetylase/Succinyl-diaminopimelate desuccinylase [Roseomonas rosea]|uniref:Acetylornithine deacetylase/Succinyl-diaminopimelate desuccinylase n=1 Tax=Muricoccus roseus TaxID=198092 RepID=A0A1M6IZJ4_9PROT|nr:dipeptidase [Roseomonas rosea]SHJ39859.1 Acetylornithine deacetylase/Succinyl-diaminopimelate desuccinylase [Roseomonas rosea]
MTDAVVDDLMARQSAIRARLDAFLRLPSVSADPGYARGMEAARDFLLTWLLEIGVSDARLLDGGGQPAVYASWEGAPGRPTLLVYGHYDVQPPDPLAAWQTDPFEPVERDGRLYARGASDVKGSTTIAIEAVAAFLRVTGGCPVNVKFFIEGEEETGSPSLRELVRRHGDLLRADAMISADGGRASKTIPTINVGARGIAGLEVALRSAGKELHSGRYGGAVRNALHEMARLIASLHDTEGRIAVPGFLDVVPDLSPEQRADTAAFPLDEAAFLGEVGAVAFGEHGYTLRERLTLRPAIDVNGMWGGYTGAGSKTVIPDEAFAKITMRLVPGQDPERAVALVADHLTQVCPPGLALRITPKSGNSPASGLTAGHPLLRAGSAVLEQLMGRAPVPVRLGATVPVTALFKELLGIDTLMFGFNLPDEDVHAPNEFFHLDSIPLGLRGWAMLLAELGRMTEADFAPFRRNGKEEARA